MGTDELNYIQPGYDDLLMIRSDPAAGLNRLYNHYGRSIKMTAMIIVKDDSLSDDVVNAVLVKVWKASKRGHNVKNFDGWLYKITKNCALRFLKKHKNLELFEKDAVADDCFSTFIEEDSFYNTIKGLSQYEQNILTLKFVQQLTFTDIAEILKSPSGSVSSAYYRAIEKLKNKKSTKGTEL